MGRPPELPGATPRAQDQTHAVPGPPATLASMEKTGSSLGMKLVALVVLLVAAWVLLKVIVGLIAGVAWLIVIVLAVVGIFWAWSTLKS